jgi:hypothetical protein
VPLDDIIFQISQRDLLGIVLLLAFLFVPIGISLFPYKGDPAKPSLLARLQSRMWLSGLNSGLLFIAITIWTIIFGSLVLGLLGVIWSFIMTVPPQGAEHEWDWRFSLAKMAGLTATLGAVVALPFTMIRLTFTRIQTETASEALFNDKINAAVSDLHAQRQVTVSGLENPDQPNLDVWQDDITRRNGAIDRLEGLAEEDLESAPRIARMLSVYVRELSQQYAPAPPPDSEDIRRVMKWARTLKPARSDMQNAVQVLGRLQRITASKDILGVIDLSGSNLQAFNLDELSLMSAKLDGVHLQGARLTRINLKRANLFGVQMQWATLQGAQLQGADLWHAHLEGADLTEAKLQGAILIGVQFDRTTTLSAASFSGAALGEVDFTDTAIEQEQLKEMFGDATVTLPGGQGPDHESWPDHWSKEKLDPNDFLTQWRAFQASIGQDPDNPT